MGGWLYCRPAPRWVSVAGMPELWVLRRVRAGDLPGLHLSIAPARYRDRVNEARPAAETLATLAGQEAGEPAGVRARLVLASFLMLFVELALIRWTAANNVYLAGATNLVLLASFLGIGIGFLNAKAARIDYLRWAPVSLLVWCLTNR
jgi:hypothetical protein